jgi:hypothetical protein
MSNSIKGVAQRALASLTMASTVLSLAGFAAFPVKALAVAPADFGLREGDTISASGSSDPDIYIVNEHGYKRLFVNPAIFTLYGHLSWAGVKAVSPATRDAFGTSGLFRNCESGDQKVYGLDVISEDVANLRWVNTSGAQAVMDDANFFKKVFCINNAEMALYGRGADYTSVLQVPAYNRPGGPVAGGSVSASLDSSNPASGTIVDGQSRYDLAHFMFSGSGAVTSLKFKRLGVSADASLTSVYLYDGARRLTDSATVADGVISFNDSAGIFSVAGSKVISVVADIDGTAGETIGVQLTSINGGAVSVSGNMHSIATATLATLAYGASTTPAANSSLSPANDVVGWQNTVTVGQRYVWLKSLQVRAIGSILPGDLRNFRLFADGVAVGTAQAMADANGYVVFDLSSNPVKLETGSRVLKVMLDVVGGSGRNFFLSVRQASDIWAVDSQYNAAVLATSSAFPVSSGQQDIASGTLSVTKAANSAQGNVVKDGSGVSLARFEFKAQGEKMKVESLRVSNTSAPGQLALRNGALFADGVQIGSTATIWEDSSPVASNSAAYTTFNLGSSLIVEPGTPRIVEIRADIYDASGTNNVVADTTITANIEAGSSNVQRLTSLGYISNSAASGNQLTVKTGSLTSGKFTGYANQSVVTPKTGVKLGHFTLAAAASENVNVNTIDIGFNNTSGAPASKTLDVFIKVLNDSGSVVYTSPVKSTVTHLASSSYSVNFLLPMSKTYQVEVWGNFDTITQAGRILTLEFSATGVAQSSGTTSTSAVVTGQTVTTATGSLTQANGTLPVARLINGGTTGTGYQFTLTPAYDDFTLQEVYVDLSSAAASAVGAVQQLILKDASGILGYATVNSVTGSASFTGLNVALPQSGGTKTFTVDVQFSNVGVGFNSTGGNVTVRLDGYKYNTSSATSTINGLATTNGGNSNIVVKGYPTFTKVAQSAVLTAGTATLFTTDLGAVGAQISWNNITFTVASNSAAGLFSAFKLFEGGVDTAAVASVSDIGSTTRVEFSFATERAVAAGAASRLELRATVGGTLATGDSVTTQIANPNGSTVTVGTSAAQANTGASFVWSDQSAVTHSTSTSDWFTDGLVKTLADSQALTK